MDIIFRPRFLNVHPISDCDNEHYYRLLNAWHQIFPNSSPSEEVDFEDWVENVVRFESAIRQYPEADFTIIHRDKAVNLNGEAIEIPEQGLFLGIHNNFDAAVEHLVDKAARRAVSNYGITNTFKRHAGREFVLCGTNAPNSPDLVQTIKDFVEKGIHDLFVKVNLQKYQVEFLSFDSVQEVEDKFYNSATAYAVMHLEEKDNAFQVQQRVKMRHEYRMIVVDHELVAGAGCIEEFTPLNNKAIFDNQLRENRAEHSGVVFDESIIDKYIEFGKQFVAEMKVENSIFSDYTLDIALDNDNNVLVIECNPFDNFGLYAMNYDAILRAQADNLFNMEFVNGFNPK